MILNFILPQQESPIKIKWKNNDGSILAETIVNKGEVPSFSGDDPTYVDAENRQGVPYSFSRWDPEPTAVTKSTEYTATYSLPNGMSETISKSWEQIIEDAENKNIEGYTELDTKLLQTKSGKWMCYELAGINKDDTTFTWVSKTAYDVIDDFESNAPRIYYIQSNLYKYLQETITPDMPDIITNAVTPVLKHAYTTPVNPNSQNETYKYWIPSHYEMNNDDKTFEFWGACYTAYTDNTSKIRYTVDGVPVQTALRTMSLYDSKVQILDENGESLTVDPYNKVGIIPCFCLGPKPTYYKTTFRDIDDSYLQTRVLVLEGNTPVYDKETPAFHTNAYDDYFNGPFYENDLVFKGWNPPLGPITKDMDYIADYEYPPNFSSTIGKTWEQIIADAESGNLSDYNLLDTRVAIIEASKRTCLICFELAAMGVDDLADGSGKAAMTWIARNKVFNNSWSGSSERVSYPNSSLKEQVDYNGKYLLPYKITQAAKEVTKYCVSIDPYNNDLEYTATYWSPNMRELDLEPSFQVEIAKETKGPVYPIYTTPELKKRYNHEGVACNCWLSTHELSTTNLACYLDISGKAEYSNPGSQYGVLFGFCLGKY